MSLGVRADGPCQSSRRRTPSSASERTVSSARSRSWSVTSGSSSCSGIPWSRLSAQPRRVADGGQPLDELGAIHRRSMSDAHGKSGVRLSLTLDCPNETGVARLSSPAPMRDHSGRPRRDRHGRPGSDERARRGRYRVPAPRPRPHGTRLRRGGGARIGARRGGEDRDPLHAGGQPAGDPARVGADRPAQARRARGRVAQADPAR